MCRNVRLKFWAVPPLQPTNLAVLELAEENGLVARFRRIKLDSDEREELARLDALSRRAAGSGQQRERLGQSVDFLKRVATKRGLDPFRCTIASDWRGPRVRYSEQSANRAD